MNAKGWKYDEISTIEMFSYRYWFKVKILKRLIIQLQNSLKEINESKGSLANQKAKYQILKVKVSFYFCIFVILKKLQLEFSSNKN